VPTLGQSNGVINSGYHDLTAHYNGYFIAREKIKEIEAGIFNKYKWNYNRTLPVFAPFDTTDSKSLEATLLECIEKASIAIQRHPESKWQDDAYILVGKARLYGSEFPEAIETFKWINKFGENKNIQHLALSQLIRTFCEAYEYQNAQAVIAYLENEKLSDDNMLIYYLNRAYYYQKIEENTAAAENLEMAVKYLKRNPDRARIEFIAGQTHQEIEDNLSAFRYYRKAMKHSKSYELSFFSKLYMVEVTPLDDFSYEKKTLKNFKKLLKDRKNADHKDKIYFRMAEYEFKKGALDLAILNYKMSIANNTIDPRQKAYAYLKLAQIYYDNNMDFRLAKVYYDSTMTLLPKDEKEYAASLSRKEILNEFVTHINTISKNDSLINLTLINNDSLDVLVNAVLDNQEIETKKAKAQAKKEARASNNVQFYNNENQVALSASTQGEWYFYNSLVVSKGLAAFKQKWGQRSLDDHWRRQNNSNNSSTNPEVLASQSNSKDNTKDTEEKNTKFDRVEAKNSLLAAIPRDSIQLNKLLNEIEHALYELGKIYNFKLKEPPNAICTFNKLINRFPKGPYHAEVLYQLYLLNKEYDSLASLSAADQLVLSYPDSIYAKLVINPNYIEDNDRLTIALQKVYKTAYHHYNNGAYKQSMSLIDSALSSPRRNAFIDYLLLLRALCFGKTDGIYKYQFELNNFIEDQPTSELIEYAKELITVSEAFQINLFSASKAKYITNTDREHYFLYLYPSDIDLKTSVSSLIDDYLSIQNSNLITGNMVFDKTYSIAMVTPFSNLEAAQKFRSEIEVNLLTSAEKEKWINLIMTKENFDIFYKTKDLDSYLTFFDKYY
jgi:tetratricopeptide (TPR) repeat protein